MKDKYTKEGYKRNCESAMSFRQKRVVRKIEREIYKKGKVVVEIEKEYDKIFKGYDLIHYLKIIFPFLDIGLEKEDKRFRLYVKVRESEQEIRKEYEDKIVVLRKENKALEKELKIRTPKGMKEMESILEFYRGGMEIEKKSIRVLDSSGNEKREQVEYSGVFSKRYDMKAKDYLKLLEIEKRIPNEIVDIKDIVEEME